jgi:hypothetical protein
MRVTFTEARREGDRSDTSRRHSVAKAWNIDRLISKDLQISNVNIVRKHGCGGDSRFSPSVSGLSFAALCPNPLLKLTTQFVYLARAVRRIIGES